MRDSGTQDTVGRERRSTTDAVSWATERDSEARRIEDKTYYLLGILDIHMPALDGATRLSMATEDPQTHSRTRDKEWMNLFPLPPLS